MKDSIVIALGTPTGVTQFTIHRPIGVTNLAADEWVVSETSEIARLLSRAEHPEEKRVNEERAMARKLLAAQRATGLTVGGAPALVVTGPGGAGFYEAIAAARAAAKAASADGKPPADAYKRHLPDDNWRAANESYLGHLTGEAVKTAVERQIALPAYITRGGPLADRAQVARPSLKGKTREQVVDAATAAIVNI
jgi:hypothetical protein